MDSDEDYISPSGGHNVEPAVDDVMMSDSDDDRRTKRKKTASRSHKASQPDGAKLSNSSTRTGFSWEDQYQRLWDVVQEDEDGRSLDLIVQNMIEARKKKIMKLLSVPFQRGIIRTVIVVIDGSLVMSEKDFRPSRFGMLLLQMGDFINEFFDQNPISQLGIVLMRNGISYLISEVSGLPQQHLEKIRNLRTRQHSRYEPKGDPLLQNALEMSRLLLKVSFGANNKNSKEILIILGALFTSDPGDIHKTIDNLVKDDIRVRVIGLSAQVAICQELVNRTNHVAAKTTTGTTGNYGVILNEPHFRELLLSCVVPLPVTESSLHKPLPNLDSGVPLIKMGFPLAVRPTPATLGLPHLYASTTEGDDGDDPNRSNQVAVAVGQEFLDLMDSAKSLSTVGYICPQCCNKVSHLPTVCPICGLMLILSTHLARSYHHLLPTVEFEPVPVSKSYSSNHCHGCLLIFPEGIKEEDDSKLDQMTSSRYRCPRCNHDFCIDCDVFVHETLHNCPGCEDQRR